MPSPRTRLRDFSAVRVLASCSWEAHPARNLALSPLHPELQRRQNRFETGGTLGHRAQSRRRRGSSDDSSVQWQPPVCRSRTARSLPVRHSPEYRVVAARRIAPSAALGNGNHTREQTSQLSQRHRLRITTVRLTAARGSPTETGYSRISKRKSSGTRRRGTLTSSAVPFCGTRLNRARRSCATSQSPVLEPPAMIGMLRKSAAFLPRYYKFESIPLQRRVAQTCWSLPPSRC